MAREMYTGATSEIQKVYSMVRSQVLHGAETVENLGGQRLQLVVGQVPVGVAGGAGDRVSASELSDFVVISRSFPDQRHTVVIRPTTTGEVR